jgi:hypothetical protein
MAFSLAVILSAEGKSRELWALVVAADDSEWPQRIKCAVGAPKPTYLSPRSLFALRQKQKKEHRGDIRKAQSRQSESLGPEWIWPRPNKAV